MQISEYRDDFVLKGGVLLAAFAARRPTKDIDLQARRLTADPDEVAERVRTIAGLALADGLVFAPATSPQRRFVTRTSTPGFESSWLRFSALPG